MLLVGRLEFQPGGHCGRFHPNYSQRLRDFKLQSFHHLLVFQAIESPVEGHVIPFDGGDLVVAHPGEGVDQVSAEAGVDVIGLEAAQAWPVLGPVGEVACQVIGRTWSPEAEVRNNERASSLGMTRL